MASPIARDGTDVLPNALDWCGLGFDRLVGIVFHRRDGLGAHKGPWWRYIDSGWTRNFRVRTPKNLSFLRLLLTGRVSKSQSWHYMSILNENVPAAVQILTNGQSADFATAVYKQFTSGTASPRFKSVPTDVQSFFVLDYLPDLLSEPMTFDLLASPAAEPTSSTGQTGTAGPTATIKLTPSPMDRSLKRGTIVAAILIPFFILAPALGFAIVFIRYRRKGRARSLAGSLPPLDPEQAMRRWSETTFNTAVSPQEPRRQSSFLPLMNLIGSPARSHALRRTLSESNLGQVANLELKSKHLEGVETQSDRAELEARTAPLVGC